MQKVWWLFLLAVVAMIVNTLNGFDRVPRVLLKTARVLGMGDEIGTLKAGAHGDAVVMRMENGSFDFFDAHGTRRVGRQRLIPTSVVKAGKEFTADGL